MSLISGFHASSEVVNDLPKLHGTQGMGGKVDLNAEQKTPMVFKTGEDQVEAGASDLASIFRVADLLA